MLQEWSAGLTRCFNRKDGTSVGDRHGSTSDELDRGQGLVAPGAHLCRGHEMRAVGRSAGILVGLAQLLATTALHAGGINTPRGLVVDETLLHVHVTIDTVGSLRVGHLLLLPHLITARAMVTVLSGCTMVRGQQDTVPDCTHYRQPRIMVPITQTARDNRHPSQQSPAA